MRFLQDAAKWIGSWWRALVSRLPKRSRRVRGPIYVSSFPDAEKPATSGKLVLVGTATHAKWIRLACPCGCGEIIALNLMRTRSPHWTVEHHSDATVSISPSVWSTTCGSHYWLRHNCIEWAND